MQGTLKSLRFVAQGHKQFYFYLIICFTTFSWTKFCFNLQGPVNVLNLKKKKKEKQVREMFLFQTLDLFFFYFEKIRGPVNVDTTVDICQCI